MAGELLAHGEVRRRQLGISAAVVPLPRSLVRRLDLLGDHGVQVMDVMPGSSAAQAGIRPEDVIVELGERLLASIDDLHRLLTLVPRGEAFTLTVVRGEQLVRLNVE